jgi:O-antigen/teichoic acid export membrane protein
MSLRASVAANYASQLYTTLIGIVLVPLYLQCMGSEAYGLVGFFAMLQAWFNLLDLGLSPTIARESSRYQAGALAALDYRRVFRSLSVLFVAITSIGGAALLVLAGKIAGEWLNLSSLPVADVVTSVRIMAVSVALRWMGGLYRGVVSGSERLVWLSGFNAVVATLRFIGVLGSMWVWGYTPVVFFWHQLVVAVFELFVLHWMCRRLLPDGHELVAPIGWSFRPVRPLLRFALTIAFTSSVWVLVTQTDKLILSAILPLAEYGYFTLAVLVAGGITIVTAPVSTAILPRMARLHAEGRHAELRTLYAQSAQLVSVVAGALAVTLVVGAESLLFAWSGNREMTDAAAPVLRLYAIGNGLLALGAFPYYLQYARGDLRYHLMGNIALVAVLVPAVIGAARVAGGIGAGWVWVAMNALYLLVWVAYVHAKLVPGLHLQWLSANVAAIVAPTVLMGLLVAAVAGPSESRLLEAGRVLGIAVMCLAVAALASPQVRATLLRSLRRQPA